MKDYLLELVTGQEGFNTKLNTMREYLQAYILKIMQAKGFFRSAAFLGGTALRFLHRLPRFSEDLDFSLTQPGQFAIRSLAQGVQDELRLAGYMVAVSCNEAKPVQYATIQFSHLMQDAGLSGRTGQKFSIKIEIDCRPPAGAGFETRVAQVHFPIAFLTYDLGSLFAGKLHALLNRKFARGRDFYDLGWYLTRWPDIQPNILLLQNALRQTRWKGRMPAEQTWKEIIAEVVTAADWKKIRQDVVNFLERPADMDAYQQEHLMQLLRQRY